MSTRQKIHKLREEMTEELEAEASEALSTLNCGTIHAMNLNA